MNLPHPLTRQQKRHFITIAIAALTLIVATAKGQTDWIVSPTAVPGTGTGTFLNPWTLEEALYNNTSIAPGDTVLLRDGAYELPSTDPRYNIGYTSTLAGTEADPITVRSYDGEWAVINKNRTVRDHILDTALYVKGSHTIYRDFTIVNKNTTRVFTTANGLGGLNHYRPTGLRVAGPDNKFIGLLVHDNGTNSVDGSSVDAAGTEIYGCFFFNNGWDDTDRNHGHGLYLQNDEIYVKIINNFIFNNFGRGIQIYGVNGLMQGFWIDQNFLFATTSGSTLTSTSTPHTQTFDEIIVGGSTEADKIVITNNSIWRHAKGNTALRLGLGANENGDAVVAGNYIKGVVTVDEPWDLLAFTGNLVYGRKNHGVYGSVDCGDPHGTLSTEPVPVWIEYKPDPITNAFCNYVHFKYEHPLNEMIWDAAPADNEIVIQANKHDPDRVHIAIYNWDGLSTIDLDPTGYVADGDDYEIYNVQNIYSSALTTGTYNGTPISLNVGSMNLDPRQPIGEPNAITASEKTGTELITLILFRNGSKPPYTLH